MRKTTTAMTVAAVATAALVVPAAPAAMASGDDVRRTGQCSGSADWKLKAKHDDGRVEVEWEVDSNRSGQTWRVRVFDNGDRVVATRATTHGPSGSFSVERKIADQAGSDHIVARARHLATGQVCSGSLTL
jgi:hypothetical protein